MNSSVFIQVVLVILAGILAARIGRRLGMPEVIPLMLAGYLLGSDMFNLLRPAELGIGLDALALIVVPVVLFYDGIKTDPKTLVGNWKTILSINTVAVLITVTGIALFCFFFLKLSLVSSFLLGAILSSTDPAAIIPMLRKLNIRKKTSSILEAETAFNDATAIALFIIALDVATGGQFSIQFLTKEFIFLIVVSVLVGVIIGLLANGVMERFKVEHELVLASIVVLICAFLVSEYLQASGIIASVVAALFFGSYLRSKKVDSMQRTYTLDAWEDLNFVATALVFLVLGAKMQAQTLLPYLWVGTVIALAFLLLIRPVTILLSMFFDKSFRMKEKLFISWVGSPRGTMSAALSTILLGKAAQGIFNSAEADAIFSITMIVIAITVVITGLTARRAAKKLLGAVEDSEEDKYRALKTELKAMYIANIKLHEDKKMGLISNSLFEEIELKHHEIMTKIEKEIVKIVKKHPEFEDRERAQKAKELLAIQADAVEEAYDRREISEKSYLELLDKYNQLLSRISELEGETP
ncbi:sodium:proton antiporter [Candidatus Micrarchaeota archaeon]|nr:sodium:proton antiporter [Candidatus Micrarchaeota archaeon]